MGPPGTRSWTDWYVRARDGDSSRGVAPPPDEGILSTVDVLARREPGHPVPICRADMERPEAQTHDFSQVPHIAGVPRYLYRSKLLNGLRGLLGASIRGDVVAAFAHEMQLCFFAGMFRQRWDDRHD